MGSGLRNIVKKSDKPPSGKGKLRKPLTDKLTDYYGWALSNNSSYIAAMRRAVMATYHPITSTDQDPHHELCPEGAESWCRHKAAEAKGEPQPKHNPPDYAAAAMLPTNGFHRSLFFSAAWERRLRMCEESFRSILWSLMPKEQHSSLRYNVGCCKATEVISSSSQDT